MCYVLGISVNVKNPKQREDVEVYVSNCLSHFDHLAVHTATRAVMVNYVCWCLNIQRKDDFLAWK